MEVEEAVVATKLAVGAGGGSDDNAAHNQADFERLKAQYAMEEIMGAEPFGSATKGGSGDVRSNQVLQQVEVTLARRLHEDGQQARGRRAQRQHGRRRQPQRADLRTAAHCRGWARVSLTRSGR